MNFLFEDVLLFFLGSIIVEKVNALQYLVSLSISLSLIVTL